MSILKNVLSTLLNKLVDNKAGNVDKRKKHTLATEEEILQAIEALTAAEKRKTKALPVTKTIVTEVKDEKLVSVRVPGCYSLYKYIGVPSIQGLEKIKNDTRIHFTIPCGWEVEPTLKFWFLCLPFDCEKDDISEYFTTYDISKAQSEK